MAALVVAVAAPLDAPVTGQLSVMTLAPGSMLREADFDTLDFVGDERMQRGWPRPGTALRATLTRIFAGTGCIGAGRR